MKIRATESVMLSASLECVLLIQYSFKILGYIFCLVFFQCNILKQSRESKYYDGCIIKFDLKTTFNFDNLD